MINLKEMTRGETYSNDGAGWKPKCYKIKKGVKYVVFTLCFTNKDLTYKKTLKTAQKIINFSTEENGELSFFDLHHFLELAEAKGMK